MLTSTVVPAGMLPLLPTWSFGGGRGRDRNGKEEGRTSTTIHYHMTCYLQQTWLYTAVALKCAVLDSNSYSIDTTVQPLATVLESDRDNQVCRTRVPSPAGDSPSSKCVLQLLKTLLLGYEGEAV